MKQEITSNWTSGMSFATELNGHKIIIDADEKTGGSNAGPRPKALILVSLAGCTGIDVVSLLKKMRAEYEGLQIQVTAQLTEEHPKVYEKIHVTYRVKGKNIDREKVEKAVRLSQDKYCGVSAMLIKIADLTWSVEYQEI